MSELCVANIFLVYRHMELAPLPGIPLKQEPLLLSLHLGDLLTKPCVLAPLKLTLDIPK